MICDSLTGIDKNCLNSFGGVDMIKVIDIEEIDTITIAAGEVTAITLEATASWVDIHFARNSASFTEEQASDVTTGGTVFTQTFTANLARRDVAKRNALMMLGAGHRDLVFLIRDNNSTWWLYGYNEGLLRGLQLTAIAGGSGTAEADLNGYTPTFTGAFKEMAYAVSDTALPTS